ncbi:MAG TPA: type VI secretion system-associated protein TagF [Reyranella sp.]|nr:type VI secretion system-associated protein TagF [Reyranella sp.]
MPCGLYGKLPMKRDFISVAVPPAFLDLWEPWLQGGITASRLALGPQWQDVFLRAPIWRFWLGSRLCGLPAMGSVMPSVDAVGRFFPLTAFACGEAGSAFPSPERDRQEAWFSGIEALLLGALDEDSVYENTLEALDKLPAPQTAAAREGPAARDLFAARMVAIDAPGQLDGAFSALLADRERRADEAGCFFWTVGGEGFPPAALFSTGLPDRNILTTFLSGKFSPSPALESHA